MIRLKSPKKETVFVVILIIIITLLSNAKLISQFYHLPADRIFIGLPHYYADFYYYLDQFYQGAHGGWMTNNNFTTENFKPVLIYFNNILLGKIGGLIGLETFTTYNLSIFFLKFFYFIVCYRFLMVVFSKNFRHRIYAFLLFLFSTSLPLIYIKSSTHISIVPIIVFREKNTFYTRFSNMPSAYLENIAFLLLILIAYKYLISLQKYLSSSNKSTDIFWTGIKFTLISISLSIFLTIANPAKTIICIVIVIFGFIFIKLKQINGRYLLLTFLPFFLVIIVNVVAIYYINISVTNNPVYLRALKWDYVEYIKQFNLLNISLIIRSFGLLGVFFILGLVSLLFKKNGLMDKLIVVGSIFSFVGFFVPYFINTSYIAGFRFILISTYLFIAIISVNFLIFIEKKFNKKIALILLTLYLVINLVTIYNSLAIEIAPLKEPKYHFAYMSKEIYQSLIYLRQLQPSDAVVLANPATTMDLVIPGITGKKSFTGHFLMNYDSQEKNKLSKSFFYDWTDPNDAKNFLIKNNIKYILVSKYSFDEHYKIFYSSYPFLKLLFSNNSVSIYSY